MPALLSPCARKPRQGTSCCISCIVVPCLHFSPAAADARVRWRRHPRPVAVFRKLAVLPVVFSLRFALKPSRPASCFICAAASGVALASSAFRRAVVSARHNPVPQSYEPGGCYVSCPSNHAECRGSPTVSRSCRICLVTIFWPERCRSMRSLRNTSPITAEASGISSVFRRAAAT